jgi:signal transduction histidine kinase
LRVKFYTDMRLYDSILFHLLSNAVKFSPTGSVVTIEVDLQEVEENLKRDQESEIFGILVTKISD